MNRKLENIFKISDLRSYTSKKPRPLGRVRVTHKSGATSKNVKWGSMVIENITFFPQHWTQDKVVEEIIYSLNNQTQKAILNGHKWEFIGLSRDGLKIKTVIRSDGFVVTSFPHYRKVKK